MVREKALVTGGAGFIGSHLIERLVKEKYEVRAFDNFSTGRRENLNSVIDRIEVIEADLLDDQALEKALAGVDFVLHQAALGSVPRSIDDPLTTHETNSTGTLKLLIAARKAGVRRVVYASSSSVYGNTPTLPKAETMNTDPLSPYALSKLSGEIYCKLFTSLYGMQTVSLRYFNVFGPRQDEKSQYAAVIPRFAAALLSGARPLIFGDGEQTRDFTYIDNVVDANMMAMKCPAAVTGEAFNIACGDRYSVNALAQELSRALRLPLAINYAPPRKGDVRDSYADIRKASQLMGYYPRVSFKKGILKTAMWFKSNRR